MESKIELTERLRLEGRWPQAALFKDETLRQLRSDGMTKADAAEEAWRRMAEKFPPLPDAQQIPEPAVVAPDPGPSGSQTAAGNRLGLNGHGTPAAPAVPNEDVDALLDRAGVQQTPDLTRDILWTYQHLQDRQATAESAPTLGAWSLLTWARGARNRFYEQLLPRALANKPPEEEENQRQEKRSIAEIRSLLVKFNEQAEEERQRELEEKLRADTPATIHEGVRSRLTNWAGRFGLSLPDGAQANLEVYLAAFVHDCAKAIGRTSGGVR
jgi:hypothetical protein